MAVSVCHAVSWCVVLIFALRWRGCLFECTRAHCFVNFASDNEVMER